MAESEELISLLKETIDKDGKSKMSAIAGRIPLLCKSVLDLHEGQQQMSKDIKEIMDNLKNIAIVMAQMQNIEEADEKYISVSDFWPVKTLIYGLVGIILVAVVYTLLHNIGLAIQ